MNLEEKKNFLLNSLYFLVWAIIIFLIFKVATAYLLPFLVGIFIAYIVQKPAIYFSKKIKIKKETLAAILSVVFYLFTIFIIFLLIWLFYNFCNNLMLSFANNDDFITTLKNKIDSIFLKFDSFNNESIQQLFYDTISNLLSKLGNFITGALTSFVKRIPALFFTSVITIVSTCYIAKDFERLKRFVKGFINETTYKKIIKIKSAFSDCFLKFTIGYFWLYLITFVELMLGLLILKIPNFLMLALLISFVDLLPVFGTGIILLPWSVFCFLQSNYKNGFGLIVLYLFIMIVRNFAEPKIIGKQININPIFTLLFIFIGLQIGGIAGMLLFPLFLTVVFTYYRRQIYNLE